MDLLPIFVATKNRRIVVVGQGQMADAKYGAMILLTL